MRQRTLVNQLVERVLAVRAWLAPDDRPEYRRVPRLYVSNRKENTIRRADNRHTAGVSLPCGVGDGTAVTAYALAVRLHVTLLEVPVSLPQ